MGGGEDCGTVSASVISFLQPEGSIAQDRYKSLLKRNIIEPRKRVM